MKGLDTVYQYVHRSGGWRSLGDGESFALIDGMVATGIQNKNRDGCALGKFLIYLKFQA